MRLSTLDSTSLILVTMLVASVVAHAGMHYELGQLAKAQALAALARASSSHHEPRRSSLEFEFVDEPPVVPEPRASTSADPNTQPTDDRAAMPEALTPAEAQAARQERAQRRAAREEQRRDQVANLELLPEAARPEAQPAPEPEPEPPAVAQRTPPPTPPPEDQARIAVRQRSQNPNDPPPDTAFIAEDNNTVEEETVAEITNIDRDDVETSVGAAMERPTETTERPGNANDERLAESEDVEGSDERRPTPEEVTRQPRERPTTPPRAEGRTESEAPPDSRASRSSAGDGRAGSVALRESAQRGRAGGGDPVAGSGAPLLAASQSDWSVCGEGSLGAGGRDGAGGIPIPDRAGREGAERGTRGGAQTGRRPGDHRGRQGPDLTLHYSQLADIVGQQQLTEEREAFYQERRSRIRGASSGAGWEQFRAALENYMPSVRPGAQTALNAARSPFATYIAQMHDRVHQSYHGFVENLPADPSGPFGDLTLRTLLEIVLNRDGSVHRVGVVRSSGLSMFDYGAYNAVMRGQPYPVAPDAILSGDGRVYMHWDFHREQPYCHQSHARPYLLPNLTPGDDGPVQRLQDTTVVPRGAQANFGASGGGAAGSADEGEDDEDAGDELSGPGADAARGSTTPPRAAASPQLTMPRSRGPRL